MRDSVVGPRVLLKRLRELMAEPLGPQERLDHIVRDIAKNMVASYTTIPQLKARLDKTQAFEWLRKSLDADPRYAALLGGRVSLRTAAFPAPTIAIRFTLRRSNTSSSTASSPPST